MAARGRLKDADLRAYVLLGDCDDYYLTVLEAIAASSAGES